MAIYCIYCPSRMARTLLCGAALALLVGCSTSPTGRSRLMLVSEQQAIVASQQAYVEMLAPLQQQGKLDNDPALEARVQRIAGRLIAQAVAMRPQTRSWDWDIRIIDDPEVANAWAMAGGKMALYTGLIRQVKPTDDELAQVLAHEIAHALAAHSAERMSIALASSLGLAALGVATDRPGVGVAAAVAAKLAIDLPNSRTAESEADRIGIELAARAGFDPHAAVTLWEKMGNLAKGQPPEFLSTHPSPANRRETLRALAEQMEPLYRAPGERPTFAL